MTLTTATLLFFGGQCILLLLSLSAGASRFAVGRRQGWEGEEFGRGGGVSVERSTGGGRILKGGEKGRGRGTFFLI